WRLGGEATVQGRSFALAARCDSAALLAVVPAAALKRAVARVGSSGPLARTSTAPLRAARPAQGNRQNIAPKAEERNARLLWRIPFSGQVRNEASHATPIAG